MDVVLLHSRYRLHYSAWDCALSFFALHNETLNIWTHVVGGLLWVREGALFGSKLEKETDLQVCAVTTMLGWVMFLASSIAHGFSITSPRMEFWLWKADYAGILILWFARILFDCYFLLELCSHHSFVVAIMGSVAIFSIAGVPVVMQKRMACFLLLFGVMHLPMLLPVLSADPTHPLIQNFLLCNVLATLCGVVGFGIFVTRIPEVCFPGRFDIWLHSHAWWHIFTTIGPLLSWRAGYFLLEYRRQVDECLLHHANKPTL
eukprot:TRINITY_DN21870_c0_g1_i18.p1 TRINITY_DN21870_c0_g1~~TRINITY_DN21870_c0_g1_i18.p1  ORF type:complete len:261 (+),score=35.80 TRINITY_DN21870_c0_g1_i18:56-838(+)